MVATTLYLNTLNSHHPDNPSQTSWTVSGIDERSLPEGADVSLLSITLPNAIYPLTNRNVITFTDSGGTSSISLPLQLYSYSQLATELQTLLNADATLFNADYAITFDTQTLKYTITAGTNFSIDGGSLAQYMGFTSVPTTSATSATSNYLARLDGSQHVDVIADGAVRGISLQRSNVLARVPLSFPFGEFSEYSPPVRNRVQMSVNALSQMSIRLVDDTGLLWKLPPNCQMSISLSVEHHSSVSRY